MGLGPTTISVNSTFQQLAVTDSTPPTIQIASQGPQGSVAYATAGTFTANQQFSGRVGIGIDPATTTEPLHVKLAGAGWAVKFESTGNVLVMGPSVNISATDTNPHDVCDIFHHSTGDGIFVAHQGGVMPAFSFTATTTNGSTTLTAVSNFSGLYGPVVMTGTGIPPSTSLVSTNVGASTLVMSNPATANGTITVSVAQPAGSSGGNAGLNVLVPFNIDGTGTGRDGTIPNNRQSQVGLFIDNQVTNFQSTAVKIRHAGVGPMLDLTNSDTAFAHGNGIAMTVSDYSNDSGISFSKFVLPSVSGSAVLKLGIPGTSPTTPTSGTGGSVDGIRLNDQNGAGRFVSRTNGQTFIGWNYPTTVLPTAQLIANLGGSGIQRVLALSNDNAGNVAGDGVQLEFLVSSNQWALVQTVLESGGGSTLRFSARTAGFTMTEYFRLGLNGIGFYGTAPVAKPASTDDLRQALINLGLYTTGGATPLNLNGGALTVGSATIADAGNVVIGTTTGSKFGTATTQKIAFYNSTPIVQPATTGTTTGFTAATGTTVVSGSTFTGNTGSTAYTIGDVVNALKRLGLLAA